VIRKYKDDPFAQMNESGHFNLHRNPTDFELNRTDPKYFHINVLENAIDSLETAAAFLNREDNLKWKWIAFAVHHALYSFCIACLVNGNYENVLSNGRGDDENLYCKSGADNKLKKAVKIQHEGTSGYYLRWENTDDVPLQHTLGYSQQHRTKTKLIGFWTALARVQDSIFYMGRFTHTKAITLSADEWKSIDWLTQNMRNNLAHFIPTLSAVSLNLVKQVCLDNLRVISFLALDSYAIMYDVPESKDRTRNAIKTLRAHLGNDQTANAYNINKNEK
jgi:hypothetical protein